MLSTAAHRVAGTQLRPAKARVCSDGFQRLRLEVCVIEPLAILNLRVEESPNAFKKPSFGKQ